jgi:Spy/CpxP family protein refolding chaperone
MKSTKTMLIAALAAGALLAGSSALRAQNATNTPPAGEHGPGMKGRANIAKQLDLSDDQKPKVEAIMKGAMEKGRALREDTSLTPEEKKDKVKAIKDDMATQLKTVLTPEQFAKWQELSKRGPRNHPPAGSADSPKPQAAAPPN